MSTIEWLSQRPRAALGWLATLLAAVLAGCGPQEACAAHLAKPS